MERSQKTDLGEFWALTHPSDPELYLKLSEWQHYYNWFRPHGALNGKTPMDIKFEKDAQTPFWDDVITSYDKSSERFQTADYQLDQAILELRRGNFDSDVMAKIAARVRRRKK